MTVFARLARDSFWMLLARIGAQACGIAITYLLARRLGLAGFGGYSFFVAIVAIGNVLTTFGTDMVLIREIAARPSSVLYGTALILQLGLSCLFIAFIFLFAPGLPFPAADYVPALELYSLSLIPLAFFTVFTSALRGWQKTGAYAFLNFSLPLLQVLVIVFMYPSNGGLTWLAGLLLGIQILGAMAAGMLCRLSIPAFWRRWQPNLRGMVPLIKASIPMAIISILGILYQKMILTLLPLVGSGVMAGSFSAAARVMEAVRMGHFAAFTVLYPAMANSRERGESSLTFLKSWKWLLGIAGGASIVIFLLAGPIVQVIFGPDYQPSIPVLRIVSLTLVTYTINSYVSLAFVVEKREKVLIPILLASLLTLLAAALWSIPRAGAVGAGWSFLLAEALQSCLLLAARWMNPGPAAQRANPGEGVSNEFSSLS